ncbi:PspC domain-containing protein [Weissella viridescens]|uniref:PspC domain-containing protein n=1 Tax=Weissella viridescens TaxID=1629 RepID=A0A3P2R9J5_WEIVI|nr:PspC domain-containing protein [Weissella viridescens]RRG17479.1 PspC domain-containing protein [Weissella viridescens]
MKKKLYKSDNRVLAGVLGGIANYLNVDPTVIRVIFVILTMLTSIVPCVIFYVIAAMIMPDMPNFSQYEREDVTPNQDDEI